MSIRELRESYKPNNIKYLLIAESPPIIREGEPLRFFYNPKVIQHDHLFRTIMECIFQDFKENYSKSSKEDYLRKFQSAGFYLIDACDEPLDQYPNSQRNKIILRDIDSKMKEINSLVDKSTPIFLIKKNIFELFYQRLISEGFNVVHPEFLPFPSSGQQVKFKERFRDYLDRLSLKYSQKENK